MKPFVRGGGVAGRVAEHFHVNHQDHGPTTLADLASFYGISRATMRKALRIAEPLFHFEGLALKVPERDSGWVVVATDDQLVFLNSTIYRFDSMAVEVARYVRAEMAVAEPGATIVLQPFFEALNDLIESLEATVA